MPNHVRCHDLENGDPIHEIEACHKLDDHNADEYTSLLNYISNYHDKCEADATDDGNKMRGVPWYAPWRHLTRRKQIDTHCVVPEEWMNTDIKLGLSALEVESRRAKSGWNEITTETENLFLKFLSYFTGPILYGNPICGVAETQSWN